MESNKRLRSNLTSLMEEAGVEDSIESFGDLNRPVSLIEAARRLGVPLSRLMEGVR